MPATKRFTATPAAGDRRRAADLAAIHIGKKALGWSEEEYRDVMATVCGGIRSSAELDMSGRKRFLAHIQACARANGRPAAPARARRQLKPHEAKIWSLWMQLVDAGKAQARTMKAIDAWVHRQVGVDSIAFLNGPQQQAVIESLKLWLQRGVEPGQ